MITRYYPYTVTSSDPQFSAFLSIDVIDANDPDQFPVGDATQDGDGQGETFINSPAGTYFLDISFYGGNYTITVEQCEGGNPSEGIPETTTPPVASTPPSSPPATTPTSPPASPPASGPPVDTGPGEEATAPESSPDTTSTLDDQNAPGPDSECPGARVVNRTSGNGDKQSPVFNVSGDSFRVTTTLDTNSPRFLFFSADVNREAGGYVTSVSRESPGTDSSIVNAGPGAFFLDILSANTDYFVAVEDCGGPTAGGRPDPLGPRPGPVDRREGVIEETMIRKIPPTGGPPIVLGALALLGTAVIVGRSILRR